MDKKMNERHRIAGRKGGIATREAHISLCPLCGNPIKSRFFAENGQKGGETTLRRHGRGFYSQIGHLGGRGNTKGKRMVGIVVEGAIPTGESKEID